MILFPSVNDRIFSSKSQKEVCSILQEITEPRYTSFIKECDFIGQVDEFGFMICPYRFPSRNSFLPVIEGEIISKENGSEILIKMRLHRIVSIFMAVWFAGVFFAFLFGLLLMLADGIKTAYPFLLVSGGMIAAGQILVRLSFLLPARKALKKIRGLLE
jgi:hypothetical protein